MFSEHGDTVSASMFLLRVRAAPTAVLTTSRVNPSSRASPCPSQRKQLLCPHPPASLGPQSCSELQSSGSVLACPSAVCLLLPRGPALSVRLTTHTPNTSDTCSASIYYTDGAPASATAPLVTWRRKGTWRDKTRHSQMSAPRRPSSPRSEAQNHPTGVWPACWSWTGWEVKACEGQHRRLLHWESLSEAAGTSCGV